MLNLYGRKGELMDGILLVNKPSGMTSHDVVNKVRRYLHTKKVGHAGTLDPLASGVLVLGINRGTKLLQFLSADTKSYRAKLVLGKATTTYDAEGEIVEEMPYRHDLTRERVEDCLKRFLGTSLQTPPIYSALKKAGKPLYAYARAGEQVEIEAREINVEAIRLLSFEEGIIEFEAVVSKGTYLRSLCVDIAKQLGYPGYMASLIRLASGNYDLKQCVSLEAIEAGQAQVISMGAAMAHFPSMVIEDEKIVVTGKKIPSRLDHQVAVYNQQGKLLAIYGPDGQGHLKSIRGLFS